MTTHSAVRRHLHRFVARYGVPAAAAGIVDRDGRSDIEVVGVRRRGSGEVALETDGWHIGSCGKSITAALFGRLVELGNAEWGVPISELLPDLTDEAHPAWTGRTVDEVLHCRSGMRPNLSPAAMKAAFGDTRPLTAQRTDAARTALRQPPRRPGRFLYSNLGYVVVGAAIDRLAGAPYEEALRTHLLEPLGIRSLGFGSPPDVWGHPPRVLLGSVGVLRGAAAPPTAVRSDNPAVLSSAGTMHVSLGDWARFLTMFVTDGAGLLSPGTIAKLLAVPSGRGNPMAMGWVRADRLGGVSFGMQGSNTMWSAAALLDDERRKVGMLVCNDGRTRVLAGTARFGAELLAA